MATHSSVLAWRIPGTGKPGGLPSLGSHRVGHDWSDLAAAAILTAYISVTSKVRSAGGVGLHHSYPRGHFRRYASDLSDSLTPLLWRSVTLTAEIGKRVDIQSWIHFRFLPLALPANRMTVSALLFHLASTCESEAKPGFWRMGWSSESILIKQKACGPTVLSNSVWSACLHYPLCGLPVSRFGGQNWETLTWMPISAGFSLPLLLIIKRILVLHLTFFFSFLKRWAWEIMCDFL